MRKYLLVILSGCMIITGLQGQNTSINQILQQIENNNRELRAMSAFMKSRQADLQTTNNLPSTEFGGYYLTVGKHNTSNYTEFQISQSFEFPTVYEARKILIDQQERKLDLDYQIKRQDILLTARQYCLDIVNLNQRIALQEYRSDRAKIVFEQISELYNKDQISILEFNKAKVFWLQEQFKIQQLDSDKQSILLLLKNLNGGNDLSLDQSQYNETLQLNPKDSIWQDKLEMDPLPQQLRQEEIVASHQLKLQREMKKPDLTAGLNYQGVNGANYSGVYAGVSVPIWSHKGKIEAAEEHLKFQESITAWKIEETYGRFEKLYNDYQILSLKLSEYQSTLAGLQSEELLIQAYDAGEISFIEYYLELSFYRDAQDMMLEFERQLYRLQNEILKHEL